MWWAILLVLAALVPFLLFMYLIDTPAGSAPDDIAARPIENEGTQPPTKRGMDKRFSALTLNTIKENIKNRTLSEVIETYGDPALLGRKLEPFDIAIVKNLRVAISDSGIELTGKFEDLMILRQIADQIGAPQHALHMYFAAEQGNALVMFFMAAQVETLMGVSEAWDSRGPFGHVKHDIEYILKHVEPFQLLPILFPGAKSPLLEGVGIAPKWREAMIDELFTGLDSVDEFINLVNEYLENGNSYYQYFEL